MATKKRKWAVGRSINDAYMIDGYCKAHVGRNTDPTVHGAYEWSVWKQGALYQGAARAKSKASAKRAAERKLTQCSAVAVLGRARRAATKKRSK